LRNFLISLENHESQTGVHHLLVPFATSFDFCITLFESRRLCDSSQLSLGFEVVRLSFLEGFLKLFHLLRGLWILIFKSLAAHSVVDLRAYQGKTTCKPLTVFEENGIDARVGYTALDGCNDPQKIAVSQVVFAGSDTNSTDVGYA
jgi:hypothetical protein